MDLIVYNLCKLQLQISVYPHPAVPTLPPNLVSYSRFTSRQHPLLYSQVFHESFENKLFFKHADASGWVFG